MLNGLAEALVSNLFVNFFPDLPSPQATRSAPLPALEQAGTSILCGHFGN